MRKWISTLTLNKTLALVALTLGAIAVFAVPVPGGTITLDAKELALVIGREADHVDPPELASWIIEARADYRLIDLRGEAAFAQYSIPGAINVPTARLIDAGLGRPEKLVLYSDDGVGAAQAWMLLRARGYKAVYMLKGGLDGWKDQVMFPIVADNPTPDQRTRDERARSVSAFFGGRPRSSSTVAAGGSGFAMPTVPTLPKVAAPASPTGGAKPTAKKREGC
ncbi:MAG: rhodanese-like domain-containing protein [Acidobacteria bacterium]|nr:rhodanese-like domain-containing protein [Acidobacteriota bacterium]